MDMPPFQPSKLEFGVYVIYNRVLNPTGDKLAVTFNGEKKPATVTPLSYSDTQMWIIAQPEGNMTYSIAPATDGKLRAATDFIEVTFIEKGFYWYITNCEDGRKIEKLGTDDVWEIRKAVTGEIVLVGKDCGNEKQRWIFERVQVTQSSPEQPNDVESST